MEIITERMIPTANAVRVDITGPEDLVTDVLHNFCHHWKIEPVTSAEINRISYDDEPVKLSSAGLMVRVKPFPGGLKLENAVPVLGYTADNLHIKS